MRLISSVLVSFALATSALAQVWEKTLAPGLTYRMEVDAATPRVVHALRFSVASPSVRAIPELADGTVYSENESQGRETVSQMVSRTRAIAGINGDFFPYTGNPLGLMVRAGELLSVPVKPRAVLGWGKESAAAGIATWGATLMAEGMAPIALDGVNDLCEPNKAVVNCACAGLALSKGPAIAAVIRADRAGLSPKDELTGQVELLIPDVTSVPVAEGSLVVVAHGAKAAQLARLQKGDRVTISVEALGLEWDKTPHVIGGGPFLVQNGRAFVDWEDEGFRPEFAKGRHPRTAVGRTADGDVWFVAVDGRQASSAGATLDELAALMMKLGCVDAINLDGGGSTAMNLFGLTVNRPTDGKTPGERKVANGVLFFGEVPAASNEPLKISGPAVLQPGKWADLTVVREDGSAIPNAEIVWAGTGSAQLDQGGRLRALGAGLANVSAWVRGQTLQLTIPIEAPLEAKPTAPASPESEQPPKSEKKSA